MTIDRTADGLRWTNWAGTYRCAVADVARPGTVEEVASLVAAAHRIGRRVKVVGAGHTNTGLAGTDGLLLDLADLGGVLGADPGTGLVTVGAATRLYDLNDALDRLGLALPILGDIDRQAVAGAIATGTHGTGVRFRNLASLVEELTLVTADGNVVSLSPTDGDTWLAAKVSLGALGVITTVTLRCVPAFRLHATEGPAPFEAMLAAHPATIDAVDHAEFWWLPGTEWTLARACTREPTVWLPPDPGSIEALGEAHPRALRFLGLVGKWQPADGSVHRSIDRSDRVFCSDRPDPFVEMEYALPREHGLEAVRRVRAWLTETGTRVRMPVEVRVTAGDDALLSTAYGRDTTFVAVHEFLDAAYQPYFDAAEAIFLGLGGRPHWGKMHTTDASVLAPRYPAWDRFRAVRNALDPDRTFANEHLDRVLGP